MACFWAIFFGIFVSVSPSGVLHGLFQFLRIVISWPFVFNWMYNTFNSFSLIPGMLSSDWVSTWQFGHGKCLIPQKPELFDKMNGLGRERLLWCQITKWGLMTFASLMSGFFFIEVAFGPLGIGGLFHLMTIYTYEPRGQSWSLIPFTDCLSSWHSLLLILFCLFWQWRLVSSYVFRFWLPRLYI